MVKGTHKPIVIQRPKKALDEHNDIEKLERIVEHAIRLGDLEYAEMAMARIDYLNDGMREELRIEFKRIMKVYEEFLTEKNERTTRATRTWMKVRNKGEKRTMIELARSTKPAEGFTWLVKEGRTKDTFEYLIKSFPNDFPSDVVQLAQNRIDREERIQAALTLH